MGVLLPVVLDELRDDNGEMAMRDHTRAQRFAQMESEVPVEVR